ncbi:MAG: cytochrome C [Chromatiales bacterium]|jgi:sulfide dehydrogenase cytochrome subunit|nr:cytochrome C [Chromatiales bacterium]MDX9768134.1 cytochrome C [Ectothiorhodospiraceae bacterium]
MIRRTVTAALVAAGVGLALTPMTATSADISRAKILASTCFTCHGTDGHSPGSIPSIYGFPAEIMIATMKGFKDGTRAATVMNRHAKGYTDEEIELLANYLSQIKR